MVIVIDSFLIVIPLSNSSSIEKSIKLFLKMKGQIAYITKHMVMLYKSIVLAFHRYKEISYSRKKINYCFHIHFINLQYFFLL